MNKWVLDQIKLELSLEAKIMKPSLPYFAHIMGKAKFSVKNNNAGKVENSRRIRRRNARWSDSLKETPQA